MVTYSRSVVEATSHIKSQSASVAGWRRKVSLKFNPLDIAQALLLAAIRETEAKGLPVIDIVLWTAVLRVGYGAS